MSLFAKLRSRKKCTAANSGEPHPRIQESESGSSNTLHFGSDQIRILLFRECEQRGRKLLFDSISTKERESKVQKTVDTDASMHFKDSKPKPETSEIVNESTISEFSQFASNDVTLLCEMVFGTVAMTYRGPSFKIHSIDSPPCLICTKVFPETEHTSCKPRDQLSDVTLAHSNSSSGSVKTQNSRPSSGYLSGNSLSPENVKSSESSSAGSGWNVDVPPPLGSSQSLDKSSSSSFGSSISSIRRRWLRAVSTSFSFTETDDMFGYYGDNMVVNKENQRHKTRLGLTMLINLTPDYEKQMENKLLEHAVLLEGILDRLRYCWIEPVKKSDGSLVERLQKATTCCTAWLMHLFKNKNDSQLLLWHDILLRSVTSQKRTFNNSLYRNLDQMCHLLDKIDTKSTNFFLSTFVTAILTHHLGWIRTVAPANNHQQIEEWERWCPYNPLWAQLGDLHGALGNPPKIVQTVIAGAPGKKNLINSVLAFASYFLRSGIVEKKPEAHYYSLESDVQKAIVSVRGFEHRQLPLLELPKVQNSEREDERPNAGESFENESPENKVGVMTSKLKRTGTFQKEMNIYGLAQNAAFQQSSSTRGSGNVCSDTKFNDGTEDESDYPSSNVRIIVSTIPSKDEGDEIFMPARHNQRRTSSLGNLSEFETVKTEEAFQNEGTNRFYDNFVNSRYRAFHSSEELSSERKQSVYFTLGGEDVSFGGKQRNMCQCANALPTTPKSPNKIVNRLLLPQKANSPLSQPIMTICEKCNKKKINDSMEMTASEVPFAKENDDMQIRCKDLLNEQEPLLEDLLRQNCVIELPMPQSEQTDLSASNEQVGFTKTLLNTNIHINEKLNLFGSSYMWGMIMQGIVKNDNNKEHRKDDKVKKEQLVNKRDEWWWPIQEEIGVTAKFPILDQPVDEAVCVLADLDNWQVGLLSNKLHAIELPLPVGMSRLVSNMLEAFLYIWKKYHSPEHCIELIETRLREMWFRSEALAQMLMVANVGDVSIDNLTSALDLDAADLPLLLSVATTHTPEIAQRFGLSFA